MANDRLILVHRPTGLGAIIASTMGKWEANAQAISRLDALFAAAWEHEDSCNPGDEDDFILMKESDAAEGTLKYGQREDGLVVVIFK